jgi:fructose-1,6-bisphosphatase
MLVRPRPTTADKRPTVADTLSPGSLSVLDGFVVTGESIYLVYDEEGGTVVPPKGSDVSDKVGEALASFLQEESF